MLERINRIWIILGGLVGLLGLMVLVAFLARDQIREGINNWRADGLLAEAREAFAAENWAQASRKGIAAHYLRSGDAEVDLLVARAMLKQRQSSTVEWWKRVADQPDLPTAELRELTEILLNSNRLEDGLYFLNRLVELDGMSAETHRLWFQALQMQARYSNSMNLAADLIDRGSSEWDIHRHYVSMQEALAGEKGSTAAREHLLKLMQEGSALGAHAAREIAGRRDYPVEDRLVAARFLDANAETQMDRLYALSVQVREGEEAASVLEPVQDAILGEPGRGDLAELGRWSLWMGRPAWFADAVAYEDFIANGNEPELYLRILIEAGYPQRLLDLAQRLGTSGGSDSPSFLYFRATALRNLGQVQQAETTLNLATQVLDSKGSQLMERYLLLDNRWDLLRKLYENQLRETPDNPRILQKLISVHYFLGEQDPLEGLVARIDLEDFQASPGMLAFMLYLKLIVARSADELPQYDVEGYLARYPEIFDFRLILGVDYFIQGQGELARQLAENMQPLPLTAPRHLRVCAILLGEGTTQELLGPAEITDLLPRERFLLSLASQQASL